MEDGGLTVFVEERMESVDFNISDIRNGLKFLMAKYQRDELWLVKLGFGINKDYYLKIKNMKTFTPKDAKGHKLASIPDFVYQAFNNLLAKNYDAYSTVILQGEVITEIIRLCPSDDITVQTIWENKWLDVEDEYRKNGWEVEYDKPGLGESYPARFIFKPKEK